MTRGKPVEPINTKFNIETRCLDVLAKEGNIAPAVATPEDIRDLIRTVGKGEATPKEIIDWGTQKYKLDDKLSNLESEYWGFVDQRSRWFRFIKFESIG